MDRLANIEAFIRVAEEGSFSAAARSLKTSQSAISKAVAALERHLDVRLLNRTTRALSLTEAGITYYERIKPVIGLLNEAGEEAQSGQTNVRGRLRVNTSAMLAGKLVLPALMAFKQAFPSVAIEVVVDDRRIDPVEQSTDVAVRVGALSDSTLRVRRAGAARVGLFAAPDYLARNGVTAPEISSLGGHRLIRYPRQKLPANLGLPEVSFTVSNSLLARELALMGAGFAILPLFLLADDLKDGRLVQVLPDYPLGAAEVSLLHPFAQDPPKSVVTFIDFAIDSWRKANLLEA